LTEYSYVIEQYKYYFILMSLNIDILSEIY